MFGASSRFPEALGNLGSDEKGFAFGSSGKKVEPVERMITHPAFFYVHQVELSHLPFGNLT